MISREELRSQLLNRQVDSIQESIVRARNACLMGNLIAFIVATAMYNSVNSWNFSQMSRRAELASYINSMESRGQPDRPFNQEPRVDSKDIPDWIKTNLEYSNGEFSYARLLLGLSLASQEDGSFVLEVGDDDSFLAPHYLDKESMQRMADYEIQQLIERRTTFDTLSLPVIGVEFASSDVGILGGAGLMVVGFWLLGSLRKQDLALQDFVTQQGSASFGLASNYSKEESLYAYKSIANAPVFSAPQGDKVIDLIGEWIFVFPPSIFLVNHLLTVVQGYGKDIAYYTQPRVLIEAAVWLCLTVVWVKAWRYERKTERALAGWQHCLLENEPELNLIEDRAED